ncbi:TetR/AcrR family transcriptional regulator [Vibrio sp. S4M6]|uniref:TetR/AcrR family transcriptional regulator n=1 Tax=Vibrio sinus TaxID=2946865 RepID=UPI002029E030|nr:TetR/AcrR family transcriptional regulator [Vibrio sinus]MCL9780702.1 TetR/AcrR family transcriptional regulator [Vibrio sinus]
MSEKKKTRSEIKREAIINAATTAFKDFGVQGTSMEKLAQIAGVSKRTVYNHFASKEELVMHLLAELWQRAIVDREVEFQGTISLQAQLSEILLAELEFIGSREYLDLARVAFGYLFYNSNELQKEFEKVSKQETVIHRWIKAARTENQLKELNVEFANRQLHSLVKGAGFWPQLMGMCEELSKEEMQEIAQESAEMFLARYAA